MGAPASHPALRILVSAQSLESVEQLAALARTLPASVAARATDADELAQAAQREPVDVALVGLSAGESARGALALIEGIVQQRACPVVLVAPAGDALFLAAGADLGIYASTGDHDVTRLRSAIAVAMARFAEHAESRRTLAARTLVECAKGILMERYGIDEPGALGMLEREARAASLSLVAGADIVVRGHRLLPAQPTPRRRRRSRDARGPITATVFAAMAWAQQKGDEVASFIGA